MMRGFGGGAFPSLISLMGGGDDGRGDVGGSTGFFGL